MPRRHVSTTADAELLKLCATAERLLGNADILADAAAGSRTAARAPTGGGFIAWLDVTRAIQDTPARTTEGIVAKAAVVRRLMAPRLSRDGLVWSLLTDVLEIL